MSTAAERRRSHLEFAREQLLLSHHRRLMVLGMLVLSTLLSLTLVIARWAISGHRAYGFLMWNLFLAWIPMWVASVAYYGHLRRTRRNGLLLGLGFLWLLFFPNSPYIWTDLVHLLRVPFGAAWWCDLMMAVSFGWNGMLLGLLSLYMIHRIVRDRVGAIYGWLMAAVALALCSFGIALGRFDRFNSWDLFSKPGELLWNIAGQIFNPWGHPLTFAIAALFFAFLSLAYLTLLALMGLDRESDAMISAPLAAASG